MRTRVLPGFPLKPSCSVILNLIPNCFKIVKNRINHSCHLMKTLKKALFSDQSFRSPAVTSHALFTPLLKLISRQTGYLPIPCFNKDYSTLNFMSTLTLWYCKKKESLISQIRTAARQGQTETGVVFCTSAHSFCFSREGGAMWPCSHLITPVGASNSHIPVSVPTWPPSLFCLVSLQAHWGMGEHFSSIW